MAQVCSTCQRPLLPGRPVTQLTSGSCDGDGEFVADTAAPDPLLCARCSAALDAEALHITEPGRCVVEVSGQLRTGEHIEHITMLLRWLLSRHDTLVRVRVERDEDEGDYIAELTTAVGRHRYCWSSDNSLLVCVEDPSCVLRTEIPNDN